MKFDIPKVIINIFFIRIDIYKAKLTQHIDHMDISTSWKYNVRLILRALKEKSVLTPAMG